MMISHSEHVLKLLLFSQTPNVCLTVPHRGLVPIPLKVVSPCLKLELDAVDTEIHLGDATKMSA